MQRISVFDSEIMKYLLTDIGCRKFTCKLFHLGVLHLVQQLIVELCYEPTVTNTFRNTPNTVTTTATNDVAFSWSLTRNHAGHPLIFILLSQQQLILVYFGSWLQVCLLHHNVWRVTAAIIWEKLFNSTNLVGWLNTGCSLCALAW